MTAQKRPHTHDGTSARASRAQHTHHGGRLSFSPSPHHHISLRLWRRHVAHRGCGKYPVRCLVAAASKFSTRAPHADDEHTSRACLHRAPWCSRKQACSISRSSSVSLAKARHTCCRCLVAAASTLHPSATGKRRARTLTLQPCLTPWSSRKLARSVGAPWRLRRKGQTHHPAGAWSRRQALSTRAPYTDSEHRSRVCLRRAPWCSRKHARSVGAPWRLRRTGQTHLPAGAWSRRQALSTRVPPANDEHAP